MDPIVLIAVFGVMIVLVHLGLAGYLYRKGDALEIAPDLEATTEAEAGVGAVVCPSCGVETTNFIATVETA